ncbi:unannotated protein [freshwater metagenome]|uniref:Unannotated protein n=1 Tax=freshwater metagenome TaxID=449393 RepID=A0A6J6Z3C2_9ZZZZ
MCLIDYRRVMARSDRPAAPRVRDALERIELDALLHGEVGEGVVLTGQLHHEFDDVLQMSNGRIERASLVAAPLASSRFVDTVIHGCDMSGADLDGVALTRVEFRECKLSGARLSQARMRDVRFIDCRMDGVNMRHAQGEFIRFEQCRLVGAEFNSAAFKGVAWWDCDLADADVSKISVERGQLHGSTLDGLRGAMSLMPIAIDAEQEPAFASLLLAALGVEVASRLDP